MSSLESSQSVGLKREIVNRNSIFVASLVMVIVVIATLTDPFMYLEDIRIRRKREEMSIANWDYAQEIFLVMISMTVLMGLGVLYLVD